MADFTRYQDVVLLRDVPEEGWCAGAVGTIVERRDVPGREPGYSVEFFDNVRKYNRCRNTAGKRLAGTCAQ